MKRSSLHIDSISVTGYDRSKCSLFSPATWLLSMIVVMLLGGCSMNATTHDDIIRSIAEAESIVAESPDEAYNILDSIDRTQLVEEHHRAHFALVMSEACYYSRRFIDVDSLSLRAVEYYEQTELYDYIARAYYQHGYVMYNANKHPEAMIALIQADKALAHSTNEHLHGVVQRTMGDIYHHGGLYQNSYDSYLKALHYFESCGLDYHIAYSKYNLGRALTMMRDYEHAEELFSEARNYAIDHDDKDFLCVVLHELSEMYLLRGEYEKCAEIVAQFEEYDCAKWLMSRYYAMCAIVELMVHSDLKSTNRNLELAELQPQRDEEIIERARYLLYKTTGDDTHALEYSEKLLLRQGTYMVDILAQPVLNYQINLLQSNLQREKQKQEAILRERHLAMQRNAVLFISIAVVLTLIIAYLRVRMAQKDRDIANYVAMIDELRLTRDDVSKPLADAVDRLYNDRLKDLNRLCETFYEHSDTSRQVSKVFEEVRLTIESIKSDEERLTELERLVDSCRNGLMSKLREQCPKLNDKELRIALYSYAGFSSRAISVFVDSNPVALSKVKYRMKTKIKEFGGEDAEMLIQNLVER